MASFLDFDRKFNDLGDRLLDMIFTGNPTLRENVVCKNPRECHQREVVLDVSYGHPREVARIIGEVCSWLSMDDNAGEIENLMLY